MMTKEDIDFILSHFESNLFPRKMMTLKSNGQFTVNSSEEILDRCKQSEFIDCRINAYAEYTEYKGIIRQPPNFIFIDLDLVNFEMDRKKLDFRLKRTLKKIEEYKGVPTVLWTGNGIHIYLPIRAIVLDQEEIFSKDKFPSLFSMMGKYSSMAVSEVFLKFAEIFFTQGRADPHHHTRYKTALIRIPNTFNSKCISQGLNPDKSKVRIIQKWDGYRIPIQYITKEFRRWLLQEEINHRIQNRKRNKIHPTRFNDANNFQIQWIEKLLQTGIPDGRKETLRLILGPYLANTKDYDDAVNLLREWLEKCNKLSPLNVDFYPNKRINSALKNSKGYQKLENLRAKYPLLYNIISRRIQL